MAIGYLFAAIFFLLGFGFVVVALALRYAARRVPREALEEAWAGEPHVLARLLGDRTRLAGPAEQG